MGVTKMEFKKCARCGCFFVTEGDVCSSCMPKDRLDIFNLKNYFEENPASSIDNISINTGISAKNVSRYINGRKLPKCQFIKFKTTKEYYTHYAKYNIL